MYQRGTPKYLQKKIHCIAQSQKKKTLTQNISIKKYRKNFQCYMLLFDT